MKACLRYSLRFAPRGMLSQTGPRHPMALVWMITSTQERVSTHFLKMRFESFTFAVIFSSDLYCDALGSAWSKLLKYVEPIPQS